MIYNTLRPRLNTLTTLYRSTISTISVLHFHLQRLKCSRKNLMKTHEVINNTALFLSSVHTQLNSTIELNVCKLERSSSFIWNALWVLSLASIQSDKAEGKDLGLWLILDPTTRRILKSFSTHFRMLQQSLPAWLLLDRGQQCSLFYYWCTPCPICNSMWGQAAALLRPVLKKWLQGPSS